MRVSVKVAVGVKHSTNVEGNVYVAAADLTLPAMLPNSGEVNVKKTAFMVADVWAQMFVGRAVPLAVNEIVSGVSLNMVTAGTDNCMCVVTYPSTFLCSAVRT